MVQLNNEEHKQTIDLVIQSAIHLQLHTDTICTACQYLHHFYAFAAKQAIEFRQELNHYDIVVLVSASLFLASKTNENHVRPWEIISSVHFHQKMTLQGETPDYKQYQGMSHDQGSRYWSLRQAMLKLEQYLLRVLAFNLTIDLPHKYLIFYLKSLNDWVNNVPLIEELFLLSWSLLNDYFCYHSESICWQPNQTVLACIELAINIVEPKLKGVIESKQTDKLWYANFDKTLKKDVLYKIIDQILTVSTTSSQKGVQEPSIGTNLKTCDSAEAK